jgi:hypothetical protein
MHRDRLMFLCNNIARMVTKHNKHARDACEQSDAFFVKTLQGWAYKTQQRDACEKSDAFFVAILQGWAYKTQQTREMHDDRLMFSLSQFCKDGHTFQGRGYSIWATIH